MQPGFFIGIFVFLAVTYQLATGHVLTNRLFSTRRGLYLRVDPDVGTLRVDGDTTTDQGREETCFKVYILQHGKVQLQNTIGGTTYTVVVLESSGVVVAIPNKDMTSNHIKEFQVVRCGDGVHCLGVAVQGRTDCYLNFDAYGLAANVCRAGAAQRKEKFQFRLC